MKDIGIVDNKIMCPACGEGRLTEHVEHEESKYKDRVKLTPLYFSTCDFCGSELLNAEQALKNKNAMVEFKNEVDKYERH